MSEPPGRCLPLEGMDAAVLVGGRGTRLRGVVDDVPKPLAPVLGRPFLFYLLDLLALRGARRVVLCAGYKAEAVRAAVGADWLGMPVDVSVEEEPLGTGGALRLARAKLGSERILALNGDSWFEPDWAGLLDVGGDDVCMALAEVDDRSRFGSVELEEGRVTGFGEKGLSGPGPINAGVYAIPRHLLDHLPDGPSSLERDLFPTLAAGGRLRARTSAGAFIDIGTPESYAAAAAFFRDAGLEPTSMFPDAPPPAASAVKLGTCAVIIDEHGRILMERRADCGWWCLPGGRLDPGERILHGATREAFEETGLEVSVERFLGLFSDPRRRIVRYPDNGDIRHIVDAVIVARPRGGSLSISPESSDLRWFAPAELPWDIVPPVIEILREALSGDPTPRLR